MTDSKQTGIVVIGRNEGERLRRCFDSLCGAAPIVYADSCSTDGSVELARSLGIETIVVDESTPLTAARGRNAGFERLMQIAPGIDLVFFIDGDCTMANGWIEHAVEALATQGDDAAIAVGRLRELEPQRSVYHRLLDLEWDAPQRCGGIFMIRASVFTELGGFDGSLRAGEEPDLCRRLTEQGHRIVRIEHDMAKHDADMTRFSQWWRRCVRAGFGYAESSSRNDDTYRRNLWSSLFWGIALPLAGIGVAWPSHGFGLLIWLAYPALWWRIARSKPQARDRRLYATFTILGKLPEAIGVLRFFCSRLLRSQPQNMETPATRAAQ